MLLKIHPENPNPRKIATAIQCLKAGGLIIYPTDTVYSIGCDINQPKAIERLARLKGIKPEKANFSIVCKDLAHLSEFTKPINNDLFRMMKRAFPGPFTFILEANSNVPKIFKAKKKSVGIRVPDNDIIRALVEELGYPIVATSVRDEDEILEYTTDPSLIHEKYGDRVDIVIDAGPGGIQPSTVINCVSTPEVIREGKGDFDSIL
jgi:tRNA threonylcarbamoyl adenosine modification protein (Sua5/YciO/YrdC/YwlC family)